MDDNGRMEFWDRVKKQIESQNTTQSWVASKVPIGPDKFSRWIKTEVMPNADQACRIAQALGTTVEYLVDGNIEKTEYSGMVAEPGITYCIVPSMSAQ